MKNLKKLFVTIVTAAVMLTSIPVTNVAAYHYAPMYSFEVYDNMINQLFDVYGLEFVIETLTPYYEKDTDIGDFSMCIIEIYDIKEAEVTYKPDNRTLLTYFSWLDDICESDTYVEYFSYILTIQEKLSKKKTEIDLDAIDENGLSYNDYVELYDKWNEEVGDFLPWEDLGEDFMTDTEKLEWYQEWYDENEKYLDITDYYNKETKNYDYAISILNTPTSKLMKLSEKDEAALEDYAQYLSDERERKIDEAVKWKTKRSDFRALKNFDVEKDWYYDYVYFTDDVVAYKYYFNQYHNSRLKEYCLYRANPAYNSDLFGGYYIDDSEIRITNYYDTLNDPEVQEKMLKEHFYGKNYVAPNSYKYRNTLEVMPDYFISNTRINGLRYQVINMSISGNVISFIIQTEIGEIVTLQRDIDDDFIYVNGIPWISKDDTEKNYFPWNSYVEELKKDLKYFDIKVDGE